MCDLPSLSVMLMVVVAGAIVMRAEGDTATNSAEKTSSSSARSSSTMGTSTMMLSVDPLKTSKRSTVV